MMSRTRTGKEKIYMIFSAIFLLCKLSRIMQLLALKNHKILWEFFFRFPIFEKNEKISGMQVIYEKRMMEKDVWNFILDMGKIEISAISQKFLSF